ncbi:MAG TPA: BMP family ABC transporter substrate-binding protein [Lachnoclostridium sp.]|nr:BMP family ABC transporter substrate-binding protein [Lachnoclostridium sp.]
MITDTGGINDQSFNQSAWEGLTELKNKTGAEVNYIESKQASDFVTNLERLGDSGANLLWGVGYACADAVLEAAGSNPDIQYAIIDNAYENTPSNVTGVMFRAQEPSFLVGYVAGRTTQTGKVGFVGGISSGLIDQFQFGYEAGVKYAAKELGKDIDISVQYAESFSDAAKGKAIAARMYSDGCDVIYHAAGGTGTGVIEAAKEADKWVIGVDRDQAYLAPENVLTSALKLVGKAVQEVSEEAMNGKEIGGKTLTFGLQEDCVGIPEEHGNMAEGVYEDTLKVKDKIKNGELTPPTTKEEYEAFIAK